VAASPYTFAIDRAVEVPLADGIFEHPEFVAVEVRSGLITRGDHEGSRRQLDGLNIEAANIGGIVSRCNTKPPEGRWPATCAIRLRSTDTGSPM